MKKNIPFCFLFCLIFITLGTFAQQVVAPGYIVNLSNDTIQGNIVDKDWNTSPHSIEFIKPNDSRSMNYGPADLRAFGVYNKSKYISIVAVVDISKTRTEELSYSSKPDTMTQQLFLQVLVNGKMNLYFNHDERGKDHFFVQKDTTSISELLLVKYLSEKDPNNIQKIERFRNQLSLYMNDCISINESIRKVTFNENELTELVVKYNNWMEPVKESYTYTSKPVHSKVGIFAGIFSANLSFDGISNPLYLASVDFNPSISFTIGGNFIIPMSKRFNRHLIALELMYKSVQFKSSLDTVSTNFTGYNTSYHYDFNISYSFLKLNIFYRLILSQKEKSDLFLDLGLSNSFVIKSLHTYDETRTYLSSITNSTNDIFVRPLKFQQSLMGGIGMMIHQSYGIKITYERERELSNYSYLSSTVNTLYLLFNYIF